MHASTVFLVKSMLPNIYDACFEMGSDGLAWYLIAYPSPVSRKMPLTNGPKGELC